MATYELTTGTREDFNNVQTQLINDFVQQVTGAEVSNTMLGTGKIVSCLNPCNNFESIIFTVHFDLDETKSYGAVAALSCGGLKFADESMMALYGSVRLFQRSQREYQASAVCGHTGSPASPEGRTEAGTEA